MLGFLRSPLLWHSLQLSVRNRSTLLVFGLLFYAILLLPFLLAKPPPAMLQAMRVWFGEGSPFVLFLFIWLDLALNKLAAIAGAILAAGLVIQEQAQRQLILYWSKPITPQQYFLTRLIALLIIVSGLFLMIMLLGLLWFPWHVAEFRPGPFILLSLVQLGAALFAVNFSAMIAVLIRRQLTALLISISLLLLLVSTAFLALYQPAWKNFLWFNPFYHGVSLMGQLSNLTGWTILQPICFLIGINLIVIALASLWVRDIEP